MCLVRYHDCREIYSIQQASTCALGGSLLTVEQDIFAIHMLIYVLYAFLYPEILCPEPFQHSRIQESCICQDQIVVQCKDTIHPLLVRILIHQPSGESNNSMLMSSKLSVCLECELDIFGSKFEIIVYPQSRLSPHHCRLSETLRQAVPARFLQVYRNFVRV